MATGDLTTLPSVKEWLGIDLAVTTDDGLLLRLIAAASKFIQSYLNRTFASTVYTETYDGTGSNKMVLPNFPITAVSSLVVNSITVPAQTDPLGTGYTFNKDRIALHGYCFGRGDDNVQITYTAGYAKTPADLENACIEIIGRKYREKERIGMSSKAIAGETTAFDLKDIPASVKVILQQYARVTPL